MSESFFLEELISEKSKWLKNSKDGYLYSAVRIVRNFKQLNFPEKISKTMRKAVENKILSAFSDLINNNELYFYELDKIDEIKYQILVERKIVPQLSGAERTKVKLLIHSSKEVFILLNHINHLSIIAFSDNSSLNKNYNKASNFIQFFNDDEFARDEKLGLLSSDLSYVGFGVKFFSIFTVPYLRELQRITKLTNFLSLNGFVYAQYNDFGSDLEDMLVIGNKECLTMDEKDIKELHKKLIQSVKELEDESKMVLLSKVGFLENIEDKISLFCNLKYVNIKSLFEIYYKLLILKDNSRSEKVKTGKINTLIEDLTKYSLSAIEGRELSSKEADAIRAQILRKKILR
ncbi:MAG: hypothetical protein JXR48_08370 [Candidatus Delongbacteria bacterium]|nr:hypothetical protein [Candidatus Delongbacteria bacterium]MBN2834969.1 hypothetical protein [Candidatus Delongbacteria bacterium]